MDEFSDPEPLKPTHFALRIYPKNEDEQWRIEMMEDISVIYTPFNYSGLTEDEIAAVPRTRSEVASPFEKSPYTVRYDAVSLEGIRDTTTHQLPILYTVWPVEKPLPDDLEYKVDYEVFLPQNTPLTRSTTEMYFLEDEAIALALGWKTIPPPLRQQEQAPLYAERLRHMTMC